MKRIDQLLPRERALLVAGGVLVVLGVLALLGRLGSVAWLAALVGALAFVGSVAVPAGIVALGVYVVWAWRAGRFAGVHLGGPGTSLHATASNERICGVCGGLASYTGLPPTLVRVAVLLLFLASPLIVGFVYLLLALALPRA